MLNYQYRNVHCLALLFIWINLHSYLKLAVNVVHIACCPHSFSDLKLRSSPITWKTGWTCPEISKTALRTWVVIIERLWCIKCVCRFLTYFHNLRSICNSNKEYLYRCAYSCNGYRRNYVIKLSCFCRVGVLSKVYEIYWHDCSRTRRGYYWGIDLYIVLYNVALLPCLNKLLWQMRKKEVILFYKIISCKACVWVDSSCDLKVSGVKHVELITGVAT